MFMNHHRDVDGMFAQTVRDCLEGIEIHGLKDSSYEQLAYGAVLENPLARITVNPHRPLNIVTALARFTWLFAGNNRLEDIAFYEPKVKGYTDNGLTVPGSNYGARLMGSGRPGSNQIANAIRRLRQDSNSRQAAAVVWTPEDANCEGSNDVPCEFGMFFNIREYPNLPYTAQTSLHMVNIMRSNNAFRLLPFNVFEFTMLGEIVASELDVPFTQYLHFANSMHVLNTNEHEWNATLEVAKVNGPESIAMPPMPRSAFQQATQFCELEAKLRHCSSAHEVAVIATKASTSLQEYWQHLFAILVAYRASRFEGTTWWGWLGDTNIHKIAFQNIKQMSAKMGHPSGADNSTQEFLDAILSQPSGNPYALAGEED